MTQAPEAVAPQSGIVLPFAWNPGEHLSIDGQTGSGKSTFLSAVLEQRKYMVMFRSKPDDVKWRVDVTAKKADAMKDKRYDRILLKPELKDQTMQFARAMDFAWQAGRWTIVLDELFYLHRLGLADFYERLLTQGRSKGITVVVGMQRPVHISRFAISECTHVISGQLEGRDARTIGDSTWQLFEQTVRTLPRYTFAWGYRPTKEVWVGRVQDIGGRV